MSDGTHGAGTTLKIAIASATSSSTTIGNITNVGNTQTRDTIDISTMDSTSKFREFIAGMADAGELTFTCNYDGSAAGTANDLSTFYQAGTVYNTLVTFPDASTWTCNGLFSSLGHAIPFDDKISQDVTIKLTGVPTYTDKAAE